MDPDHASKIPPQHNKADPLTVGGQKLRFSPFICELTGCVLMHSSF